MIDVLCSGGLDSYVGLAWAIDKWTVAGVRPVYFDLGQQYAEREIKAATAICARLRVVLQVRQADELRLQSDENGHIPFRNTVLLLRCAMHPDSNGIVFGMLRDEQSEDKGRKYVRLMQRLFDSQLVPTIQAPGRSFKIYTPFGNRTKTQMLKWFMDKFRYTSLPEGLWDTVACFGSGQQMCGNCVSCYNRWVAMSNIGLGSVYLGRDVYQSHPAEYMLIRLTAMWKGHKVDVPRFGTWTKLRSPKSLWLTISENYGALNRYCKLHYQRSLLRELRKRNEK